jgi:hypothetical protein
MSIVTSQRWLGQHDNIVQLQSSGGRKGRGGEGGQGKVHTEGKRRERAVAWRRLNATRLLKDATNESQKAI